MSTSLLRLTALAAAAVAVLDFATLVPAGAQVPSNCAKRADVLRELDKQFTEAPVGIGLTEQGTVLEIFTSADGSTWTVTVTTPAGITCLIASGQDWQSVPRVLAGKTA